MKKDSAQENMIAGSRLSRRQLLYGGAAVAVTTAVAGCDLAGDPGGNNGDGGNGTSPSAVSEAPALATLVEAGELPSLSERLPEDPVVVEPIERTGVYGGTWNSALLGPADSVWLSRTIGYEPLLRWDPEWSGTVPNVAESVQVSADGREFTVSLRSGMKWSDGTLFTTDDLVFAYEDVLRNEELTPTIPGWLVNGDEPAALERIDDRTVRIVFARPNGLFLDEMAIGRPSELINYPRHYLEQFHLTYSPDVEAAAKGEGFETWVQLFQARSDVWNNVDKPTLHAWIVATAIGESTRVVAERNPYYWKTDPEGRQLPYIDRVAYEVAADAEVILLRATNGELHFDTRHTNRPNNKPVLANSRESGNYDFITLQNSVMNEMVISLNLTHDDPVRREIFQNKDFRIGLSHAINRPELIEVVFQRQGQPWQAAPMANSEFFDEAMALQYIEYDLDLANGHLDRAGYGDRDDEGFRLGPEGGRISFDVEIAQGVLPFWVDAMTMVIDSWKQVGIDARVNAEDRSLFSERINANEHDATVWVGPGGFRDEITRGANYLPTFTTVHGWAVRWALWFQSRGEATDAEQPPASTLEQMELYWELLETPDEAERAQLFRQILAIAKDQFYTIGTVQIPEGFGIKRNDFHNVPQMMPRAADYPDPAPTNPHQYFIE